MLYKRVLTAALVLPLVIGAVHFLPEKWFSLFISFVALVAAIEFAILFFRGSFFLTLLFPLISFISVYCFSSRGAGSTSAFFLIAFLVFALLKLFFGSSPINRLQQFALIIVAYVYIVLFLPYFTFLKGLPGGEHLIYFIALNVFLGDTAAYFVGSHVGKIKLAPLLSPNKTVEGAIAGAIVGTLSGFFYLKAAYGEGILLHPLLLSFIVSIVGQAGDLFESMMKRAAGVKDSGVIFPGHGGMLDRIDSLILNAFVVFISVRGF